MTTEPSGVRERLVEAAARAAFKRDYARMGSEFISTHEPEMWHRQMAERMVDAVFPLIADRLDERSEQQADDGNPEQAGGLAEAAWLLRSWSS